MKHVMYRLWNTWHSNHGTISGCNWARMKHPSFY